MTRVLALALAARAAWVDETLFHINPLSYDPSKSALGRTESKVITDEELLMVLDRSGGQKTGRGFMLQEKTTSAFDSLAGGSS